VLPYPKFRAFYNAAIDDSNGKGKLAKKPSAADQKRASMAASCLASSKAEAHPLFPNVQPANSAELADFSRRLRKFMVTQGLEEAEWAKVMAMMDDQVPGEDRLTWEHGHTTRARTATASACLEVPPVAVPRHCTCPSLRQNPLCARGAGCRPHPLPR